MKKMLMLTSVASMIEQFLLPHVRLLKEMGFEVEVACNFREGNTCSQEKVQALCRKMEEMGVVYHQIDFVRSVAGIGGHRRAYKQAKALMQKGKYDFVHCHSPIGGALGRMAAKKTNTKALYTAHGFHFYKGAPLLNWLLFYPIERHCSRFTETLFTINREDYARAQKRMKAKKIAYVAGIGVNLNKFRRADVDRAKKRAELGIPENATLLLSVGEINKNKNHQRVIRAIANSNEYYLIAGQGDREEEVQALIDELGVGERVKLLGFRADVKELYAAADIFVFPSYREGLSVALMEAMASGLPCVASNIRGNVDLIDEKGGVLFNPKDTQALTNALSSLTKEQLAAMGKYNEEKIKTFGWEAVSQTLREIYAEEE